MEQYSEKSSGRSLDSDEFKQLAYNKVIQTGIESTVVTCYWYLVYGYIVGESVNSELD